MKKQKRAKKNIRKNNNYNGRNIFGQRCNTKVIKLEQENAMDQFIQMFNDIEESNGGVEYTIDLSGMSDFEVDNIQDILKTVLSLRSHLFNI